jgi:ABC-2 type transport system ATP-binding protein
VFLSSHLMSEMAVTADHLIIIGRGRLIRDVGLAEFVDEWSRNVVRVRSPQATDLRDAILGPDVRVSSQEPGVLEIDGLTAEQVGDAAARHGFVLHELIPEKVSLEEAFMDLTREETEFRATTPTTNDLADSDRQERIAA